MQYNKRNFGEAVDALTVNPYFEDVGMSSGIPPVEPLYLITEGGDNFITEGGDMMIAEQSGI